HQLRNGVRIARGRHLREGAAARAAGPARHGARHGAGEVGVPTAAAGGGLGDWILFWIVAPISVVSAGGMILARNAVHAALLLIVNLFTISVFFLVLGSPFLFVVQIIVYAGAIMVLFLFVIMLLGVDRQ